MENLSKQNTTRQIERMYQSVESTIDAYKTLIESWVCMQHLYQSALWKAGDWLTVFERTKVMIADELVLRYTYHPPTPEQVKRYELIRNKALEFAHLINELTPESREQSLAFTALDEVVSNANAAIARRS